MNNYVTFDGKKYSTTQRKWEPVRVLPGTDRRTLSGSADVTYGPAPWKEWRGEFRAYTASPPTGWGSIADLRTSLEKRSGVTFIDHFGGSYTVHAHGNFVEQSPSPNWVQADSRIFVTVRLVAE